MVELNLFTGQPVGATGVVREAGRVLVVPAEAFRSLVGRELVFGDFVLQLLFRRRQALERLLLGIRIVGSRFDRDTHRLREFAARNRVAHEWIDGDEPRSSCWRKRESCKTRATPELAEALGLHQALFRVRRRTTSSSWAPSRPASRPPSTAPRAGSRRW